MKPIPATDASTLAYLAEFPDVEAEDRELLLAPLTQEAREIANVLLGDSGNASPDALKKAKDLQNWAVVESEKR